MLRKDLHDQNRRSWNEATAAHNSHKRDQARFLREGGSTLFPEEVELLGNIAGQSLVHLQCNAGQDTLSLAHLGASVTGVDISETAIEFARQLSADAGIPATFERMDVYDWLEMAAAEGRQYDVVFSSYGALCWLSDLPLWARGIAAILKPGGRLVVVEFHPFGFVFEEDWSLKYPYPDGGKHFAWDDGIGDYVGRAGDALAPSGYLEGVKDFVNPVTCHEFAWGVGDIVMALIGAGLTLTTLREYPFANGAKQFDRMRELPGGRMAPPEDIPSLPLMLGVAARK
jgi:SAM-dependent methyltransferase